jgi:hypothetical protein
LTLFKESGILTVNDHIYSLPLYRQEWNKKGSLAFTSPSLGTAGRGTENESQGAFSVSPASATGVKRHRKVCNPHGGRGLNRTEARTQGIGVIASGASYSLNHKGGRGGLPEARI